MLRLFSVALITASVGASCTLTKLSGAKGARGSGASSGSLSLSGQDAFRTTVYPITRSKCVSCHASAPNPPHASADLAVAYAVAKSKVSLSNIPSSRLVVKTMDGHCGSACSTNGAEMIAAITAWKGVELAAPAPSPTPTTDPGFTPPPVPTDPAVRTANALQVVQSRCVTCHASFNGFSTDQPWIDAKYVIPGRSSDSIIFQMLQNNKLPGTLQLMPLGGPALSDADINTFKVWIDNMPLPTQTCGTTNMPIIPARVILLSGTEITNSVTSAFNSTALASSINLPNELNPRGAIAAPDLSVPSVTTLQAISNSASAVSLAVNINTVFAFGTGCSLTMSGTTETTCVNGIISNMGKKLFRRPLTTSESNGYSAFYQTAKGNGASPEVANRYLVQAMLMSPNFLYRTELGTGTGTVNLTPYEVASAISYTTTGSPPDSTLMTAAQNNQLQTAAQLQTQVSRLLATASGRSHTTDFVKNWFGLDNLSTSDRAAIDSSVSAGGSVSAIFAPSGGNLFGSKSFLARYAHSGESAPVLRGKAIWTQFLCQTLPPPPPNVVTPTASATLTTRQRYEQTTETASCIRCHQSMNQLGFAFENYDGNGNYRSTENGVTIDTSATIYVQSIAGTKATGPTDMMNGLVGTTEASSCFATKAYSLVTQQSSVGNSDSCYVGTLGVASQTSFSTLFQSMVGSPNYIKRAN